MFRSLNAITVAVVLVCYCCCSVVSAPAAFRDEEQTNSLSANDAQQYHIPSLLTQRIRSCMDRLDGSIESSQVMITALVQQLNHLAVESSPDRPAEDGEATSVQFVRIQTTDDRGMLIWTSNGYYISLSFILFLHLMILFVFGLISLCFSKPSAASAQPKHLKKELLLPYPIVASIVAWGIGPLIDHALAIKTLKADTQTWSS
ncbi:uncharacterized protein LOC115258903 [Aedes albopictus]|uniref:Membrane-associated protein n=1 Tax=Aedes albopictus TaxID=7160 RepID=A0ABM1XVA8_AEDAL